MAGVDVGIFHDLDSKNYLRTFVRNEVRPDGRSLTEPRKLIIGTGCYFVFAI
jgi:exosome complex RNA-binding protein Rrp42 (RNase PH superfamily)